MPDFIVQKLLLPDPKLYCSQGQLAGGCVTHATASALAALGVIRDPSRISERRCEPRARRLWQKMKDSYTDGISLTELAKRLETLDFGLKITQLSGSHARVLAFTEMAILRGRPVVVSFRAVGLPRSLHAVMVVGVEGKRQARRFVPHSLLINDSSGEHPGVGCHNAKMDYSPASKRERSSMYVSAWERYRIVLSDAVSLQLAGPARRDLKSP
jgi:hypothetical protein